MSFTGITLSRAAQLFVLRSQSPLSQRLAAASHPAPHELACSQVQSTPAWLCTTCSTSSTPLAIMCLKADRLCAVLLAKIAETLFFMLPIVLMLSLKHSSRRYLLIASELLGSILCLSSFFLGLLHIEPHINGVCSYFKIRAGRQSCVTDTHCGSLAVPWAQRGAEVGSWGFLPSLLPALQKDISGGWGGGAAALAGAPLWQAL